MGAFGNQGIVDYTSINNIFDHTVVVIVGIRMRLRVVM